MVFPINVIDLPCYMVVFWTIDQGPFKVVLDCFYLLLEEEHRNWKIWELRYFNEDLAAPFLYQANDLSRPQADLLLMQPSLRAKRARTPMNE